MRLFSITSSSVTSSSISIPVGAVILASAVTAGAWIGDSSGHAHDDDRSAASQTTRHDHSGESTRSAASSPAPDEDAASWDSFDEAETRRASEHHVEGRGEDDSSSRRGGTRGLSDSEAARAQTIMYIISELRRRQGNTSRDRSQDRSLGEDELPREEPEYSTIRPYLTDFDEAPADVRDVPDILGDPSNVISSDNAVSLLAWDVRNEEPRGSYLYVLQQNQDNQISQIHRYFCHERRLDILIETCQPVASIYSESGVPMAVGYTEDGQPVTREADDLDRSLFSRSSGYVEANEFLFQLQEYLDSIRG